MKGVYITISGIIMFIAIAFGVAGIELLDEYNYGASALGIILAIVLSIVAGARLAKKI